MNLLEGLQKEITRNKELVKVYEALPNNTGLFAASIIKQHITDAENAIANADITAMIYLHKELSKSE